MIKQQKSRVRIIETRPRREKSNELGDETHLAMDLQKINMQQRNKEAKTNHNSNATENISRSRPRGRGPPNKEHEGRIKQ